MHVGGSIGGGMIFMDDLAVAQDHQVVHVHIGLAGQIMDKGLDQLAAHALFLGCAAGQLTHLPHGGQAGAQ